MQRFQPQIWTHETLGRVPGAWRERVRRMHAKRREPAPGVSPVIAAQAADDWLEGIAQRFGRLRVSVDLSDAELCDLAAQRAREAFSLAEYDARVHNFFGLSDYGGEILYDGWIYFGESAGIKIIDRHSAPVRKIDAVIPIISRGGGGPPTGWTVYYDLQDAGYTSKEAFSLLGEAAADSIRHDPAKAAKLLMMKLRQAPRPEPTVLASISSGGLSDRHAARSLEFFDVETGLVRPLGPLQDTLSDLIYVLYPPIAAVWLAYSLLQLWMSSYRRPSLVWLPLVMITLIVLLLPTVLGLVSWRYLLPGLRLLTPMALASSDTLGRFAARWYLRRRAGT